MMIAKRTGYSHTVLSISNLCNKYESLYSSLHKWGSFNYILRKNSVIVTALRVQVSAAQILSFSSPAQSWAAQGFSTVFCPHFTLQNKCSDPLWMKVSQGNMARGSPYNWCWAWQGFSVSWLVWEGANWAEEITTVYLAWDESLNSECHWTLRGCRLCKLCFPTSIHCTWLPVGSGMRKPELNKQRIQTITFEGPEIKGSLETKCFHTGWNNSENTMLQLLLCRSAELR